MLTPIAYTLAVCKTAIPAEPETTQTFRMFLKGMATNMKNTVFPALALTAALLFTVCGCQSSPHYPDETDEDMTSQETHGLNEHIHPIHNTDFPEEAIYQYFPVYQYNNSSVFSKFNVTTGEVSPLCSDPLCKHNDYDCMFYNIDDTIWRSEDGSLFYYFQWGEDENRIMSYRIADNHAEVLYSEPIENVGSQCQPILAFGYYWCRYVAIDVFYRVNLLTGEREELDATYNIPTAYIDGRFYCTSYGSPSTIVYSLDENMQDQQIIAQDVVWYYVTFDHVEDMQHGYITFSEWTKGEFLSCKYDLSTGEVSAFSTDLPYSTSDPVYQNKHFYQERIDNPRFMGTDELQGHKIYNNFGGKVYAFDSTTGESEVIFDNDDYVFSDGSMVEQYLIYDYGEFVRHPLFGIPSWEMSAGGKIVINAETNEYCIYPDTWDECYDRYS